jgi:multidrug efflux pump subunit AcrA (membrane-fusion protein)
MKWLSKKWLIGISAFILLFLLWLAFRQPAIPVEIGTVRRGEMVVTIDAEGKTSVRDRFVVTAPVAGRMARIKLREGDQIAKDFVITGIDPAPATRPLPPSQNELFPNVYAVKVYSPVSGRILRILEKNERMVAAGIPLLEIGNPETLEIIADVLSTQATQIKPGAKMLIENWGGANPLTARVRKIEPQAFTKVSALGVEEQRVNIIADLITKNVRLGDNFRVETSIITWQKTNVLQVLSSALFRQGEKWNVFVVAGGTARQREVEVGHQNLSESEIIKGLNEDEQVILHPSNQITDGVSVSAH